MRLCERQAVFEYFSCFSPFTLLLNPSYMDEMISKKTIVLLAQIRENRWGVMGGCPLCFDMGITSFCFFEGNGSARFRNVNQHFKLAA